MRCGRLRLYLAMLMYCLPVLNVEDHHLMDLGIPLNLLQLFHSRSVQPCTLKPYPVVL